MDFSTCPLCNKSNWSNKKIPARIYGIITYERSCSECICSGMDRFRLFYLDEECTDLYVVNFALNNSLDISKSYEIINDMKSNRSTIRHQYNFDSDIVNSNISESDLIKWDYTSRSSIEEKLKVILTFI